MRRLDKGSGVIIGLLFAAGGLLAAAPEMPSWLVSFAGATPKVQQHSGMVQSTYTTPAKPAEVVEHYRKLFDAAGLKFQPNGNGVGVTIRASAPECDLMILVNQQGAGTFVDVYCTSKSPDSPSEYKAVNTGSPMVSTRSMPSRAMRPFSSGTPSAAEMQARHEQAVRELGIHPEYHDAPAPPLVWPQWLTHIQGAALKIQKGVDESRKNYLESRYISSQPMSAIYKFYEDLLNSNEYRVHNSNLSTGQTISGITQNANGYVEGTNYPDGAPGARTVIHVSFSRFKLNEPITVRMRITAYEFVAPKRSF